MSMKPTRLALFPATSSDFRQLVTCQIEALEQLQQTCRHTRRAYVGMRRQHAQKAQRALRRRMNRLHRVREVEE